MFVRIRDGVEGHIPSNEIVEEKGEDGEAKALKVGDAVTAEIANIDTQDRRLTLSMRTGETVQISSGRGGASAGSTPKSEKARVARLKKAAVDDAKAVGLDRGAHQAEARWEARSHEGRREGQGR